MVGQQPRQFSVTKVDDEWKYRNKFFSGGGGEGVLFDTLYILLKSRFFGLHVCGRQWVNLQPLWCNWVRPVIGPKATEFSRITQNNGHYHWFWYQSKTHMRLPIIMVNTNFFLAQSKLLAIIGHTCAFEFRHRGYLSLTHLFGMKNHVSLASKTRNIAVSCGAKCVSIYWTI